MSQRGGGMGGGSQRGEMNTATIQTYLEGIDYPANRDKLVQTAKDNGAPQTVISVLQQLPQNKQFRSPIDVNQALSDII